MDFADWLRKLRTRQRARRDAARVLTEALLSEDDELAAFRRRHQGARSRVTLEQLRRARQVLVTLAELLQRDEPAAWAELDEIWERLCTPLSGHAVLPAAEVPSSPEEPKAPPDEVVEAPERAVDGPPEPMRLDRPAPPQPTDPPEGALEDEEAEEEEEAPITSRSAGRPPLPSRPELVSPPSLSSPPRSDALPVPPRTIGTPLPPAPLHLPPPLLRLPVDSDDEGPTLWAGRQPTLEHQVIDSDAEAALPFVTWGLPLPGFQLDLSRETPQRAKERETAEQEVLAEDEALPFSRAPGARAPMPSVVEPAPDSEETERRRAKRQLASPANDPRSRTFEADVVEEAPPDTQPPLVRPSDVPPSLPSNPAPPPSGAPPSLSLEQYASLCAQRQHTPDQADDIDAQFGLDSRQASQALALHWEQRFAEEPRLRLRHQWLVRQYRVWFQAQS